MIVDLHAHYPMHLLEGKRSTSGLALKAKGALPDWLRGPIMQLSNRAANYPAGKPVVDIPNLMAGNVRVALSVLIDPFSEIDTSKRYAEPPDNRYFAALLEQMDLVEASIAKFPDAVIGRNGQELDRGLAGGKVTLIHAVEGGFHFGADAATVEVNVAEAAKRGVAYVTIAHLFWRRLATNAPPALPGISDWLYHVLFKQPGEGLSDLGRALITAMVKHRILIDVTHMSAKSLADTFALLDQLDPDRQVPVMATHSACRLGGLEYNLSDRDIETIAARGGVVGLMACRHFMADKTGINPKTFDQSVEVICKHIDRLQAVTHTHDYTAIGSDFDGFIQPTLPEFNEPAAFPKFEAALGKRYAAADVEKICFGNALRVLRYWGQQ